MRPLSIRIQEKKNLFIEWDDGTESLTELKAIRHFCPCAFCSDQRLNQSPSYIPLYFEGQVKVDKIFEVGTYAVGIAWKDGHNTGIYEFPLMRQIALASTAVK